MLLSKFSSFVFAFFFTFSLFSQSKNYPQNYFRSPIDIPISPAGTFGELRPNHFHSGLDIRTAGRTGLKVHAAADGYISRIKKSPWGYGYVLYMNHPNGYTTVYGHLSRFNDKIAAYVEAQQYKKHSWQVDLHPPDSLLRFKKGDVIALSGESGDAAGPHVHFEVRDTKTQMPINPLLFGLKAADDVPPTILAINIYALGDSSSANGKTLLNLATHGSSGNYILSHRATINVRGTIAFAVKCYDKFTGGHNRDGVYKVELLEDGKKVFGEEFNTFKFSNTRAINSLIDYPMYLKYHSRYNRSIIDPGNPLDIYTTDKNSGKVEINDSNFHIITYKISDYAGNVSRLIFKVKGNQNLTLPKIQKTHYSKSTLRKKMLYNADNTFMRKGLLVNIPDSTLFTNINFTCRITDTVPNAYAPLYHIGNYKIPLLKKYTIGIKTNKIPDSLKSKAVIAKVGWHNKAWGEPSKWDGKYLSAKVRYFGNYTIEIDTVAPTIEPLNIDSGKNMSADSGILIKIGDNKTGVQHYAMYMDKNWVLTQYLKHKRAMYYRFDKHVSPGKHHLKAVVTDGVGNKTIYEADFMR